MNSYKTYVLFQILYIIIGIVVSYWVWEIRCSLVPKMTTSVKKFEEVAEILKKNSRDETHYNELLEGYREGNITEAQIRNW